MTGDTAQAAFADAGDAPASSAAPVVGDAMANPPAVPSDLVEVGRIVGGWGVRGWIKVAPFSGDPADSVLLSTRRWWLLPAQQRTGAVARRPSEAAQAPESLRVERSRVHADTIVARPAGFADRDQADACRGRTVAISRSEFPPAGDDTFYWVDLIGCRVENPRGDALGDVTEVDDHGAHALLHVLDRSVAEPVERLIPFVSAYIVSVDLAGRLIVADWELDY